jgi:hypothetical protein
MGLGRLQVAIPDVTNESLPWAMTVLPLGPTPSPTLTPIGAGVWVTFENDDIDFPVVLGQFATLPFVTPVQLAAELGHDDGRRPGRRVRQFLRERYPEHPAHERWQLTPAQADEVRAHFNQ